MGVEMFVSTPISFLCFILLYLSLIYRYTRLHIVMKPGMINYI